MKKEALNLLLRGLELPQVTLTIMFRKQTHVETMEACPGPPEKSLGG